MRLDMLHTDYPPGYKVRKVAQVVAFFAMKENINQIGVLKLVKLMYLADREFLSKYDSTILYDQFVSMPHGPVNSFSYNFISGCYTDKAWDDLLTERTNHLIGLKDKAITVDSLDELSDAEISVLEEIWARFGAMDGFALEKWTHENCPEWEDPKGSSNPIPYERVLKHLQKNNSDMLAEAIEKERKLHNI